MWNASLILIHVSKNGAGITEALLIDWIKPSLNHELYHAILNLSHELLLFILLLEKVLLFFAAEMV